MLAALPEGWGEFGVAAAGATAALAGLLFVAISVNVREILSSTNLVRRAASTVASLVLGVVVSLTLVIPAQPGWVFGLVVLVATAIAGAIETNAVRSDLTQLPRRPVSEGIAQLTLASLQFAPLLVGAILLLAGVEAGLVVVAAGIIAVVIGAMVNAWVLLVEILR